MIVDDILSHKKNLAIFSFPFYMNSKYDAKDT